MACFYDLLGGSGQLLSLRSIIPYYQSCSSLDGGNRPYSWPSVSVRHYPLILVDGVFLWWFRLMHARISTQLNTQEDCLRSYLVVLPSLEHRSVDSGLLVLSKLSAPSLIQRVIWGPHGFSLPSSSLNTLKAVSSGTSRAHLTGERLAGTIALRCLLYIILTIILLNLFYMFGIFQEGGYIWSLLLPLDQEQKSLSISFN